MIGPHKPMEGRSVRIHENPCWANANEEKKVMDSRESMSLEDHLIGLGLTNHNVLLSLSTNQYLSVI